MRAEFTVEPFVDGHPGPHVQAAIAAAGASGATVEVGPFGTAIAGADDLVLHAIDAVVRAATGAGATRLTLQITTDS